MHFADRNKTCKEIWLFFWIWLMYHTFVSFACGTRLIGIDAGHNDNFISNFLLDFAKSGQIVQHCIFIVCGTWTNDCEKFIRFACKNIFKFFVAGIFDCLKFCINRKLIADFFRSW